MSQRQVATIYTFRVFILFREQKQRGGMLVEKLRKSMAIYVYLYDTLKNGLTVAVVSPLWRVYR